MTAPGLSLCCSSALPEEDKTPVFEAPGSDSVARDQSQYMFMGFAAYDRVESIKFVSRWVNTALW